MENDRGVSKVAVSNDDTVAHHPLLVHAPHDLRDLPASLKQVLQVSVAC